MYAASNTTPEREPSINKQAALNCTEEVKRTLSRISSIKEDDETAARNEQTKSVIPLCFVHIFYGVNVLLIQ